MEKGGWSPVIVKKTCPLAWPQYSGEVVACTVGGSSSPMEAVARTVQLFASVTVTVHAPTVIWRRGFEPLPGAVPQSIVYGPVPPLMVR